LLDALRVHAAQDDALYELEEMLDRRGEVVVTRKPQELSKRVVDWLRAFHDAHLINGSVDVQLSIGPCKTDRETLLSGEQGELSKVLRAQKEGAGVRVSFRKNRLLRGVIELESSHEETRMYVDEPLPPRPSSVLALPCQYISATGLSVDDVARLWDSIVLTEHEDTCLKALRIIEPDIQRVALVDVPGANGSVERAPHVSRASRRQPEPLHSLGEGMSRIFEIMLSITNARGGRLLIDEIENGLHYSIHETLWRHIFDVAAKLDVQVFATTHSWGCIDAFQAAARAHPDDGILIRLDRRESESIAYLFDEDELAVVSEQAIEVR
jgi:hypothetical protein